MTVCMKSIIAYLMFTYCLILYIVYYIAYAYDMGQPTQSRPGTMGLPATCRPVDAGAVRPLLGTGPHSEVPARYGQYHIWKI